MGGKLSTPKHSRTNPGRRNLLKGIDHRTTQVKKQRKEYGRKRLEKRASELLQMGLQTAKRQWWVIQGKTETGQTW
ncbi:predicted protein [Coccidioides posadasii str. Silveira]|uniref:Predicted protein n=1 Tax=Coccidioides posadasii (strain RMSCC 757 / Silveira) TaxID=443226 RepID=E9CYW1_COCPS|nr:predicted protein [Coccidioides posadasii str. Silveira]